MGNDVASKHWSLSFLRGQLFWKEGGSNILSYVMNTTKEYTIASVSQTHRHDREYHRDRNYLVNYDLYGEYSLLCMGKKYHCTADLLLYLFGFGCFVMLSRTTNLLVWLNPSLSAFQNEFVFEKKNCATLCVKCFNQI